MKFIFLLLLVSCLPEKGPLTYSVDGVIEEAEGEEVTSFKTLQDKILIPKCLDCHGWVLDEEKVKTRIVPGKPEESRLFRLVENGRMPKGSAPLQTIELEKLRSYIESLVARER